uniref:ribosomal protein L10 n=1 Tax=Meteora sporadica TaxID=2913902 RepID=UPI003002D4EB|nr:ribosomal protein L10 [Meteora sporadica]
MKNITLTLKKQRYHLLNNKLNHLFKDFAVLSFYTSSSLGTDELLELKATLPKNAGILHIPTGILRFFLDNRCKKTNIQGWTYLRNLVGNGKVFILYQKHSLGVSHLINLEEMPNLIFLGIKYYNYLLGPNYFKSYKDISLSDLQATVLQLIESNNLSPTADLAQAQNIIFSSIENPLQDSVNQLDWLLQSHSKGKKIN